MYEVVTFVVTPEPRVGVKTGGRFIRVGSGGVAVGGVLFVFTAAMTFSGLKRFFKNEVMLFWVLVVGTLFTVPFPVVPPGVPFPLYMVDIWKKL